MMIKCDFGSIASHGAIDVKINGKITHTGREMTAYLESSSDDSSWTVRDQVTIGDPQGVAVISTLSHTSISFRYYRVRWVSTGSYQHVGVYEFQIAGLGKANLIDNDVTTVWYSDSEANPYCYFDMGTAKDLGAIAINLDRTLTTVTTLKIDYSTDTTFSGEQVRTMLVSDFTDDTWRYINIPRQLQDRRYVKIGSTDTGVLAINELKYFVPTDAQWTRGHFHKYLTPTDTTANTEDSN